MTARSLAPFFALSARSPRQILQVVLPLQHSGTLARRMGFKVERNAWREGSRAAMFDLDVGVVRLNVPPRLVRCVLDTMRDVSCDAGTSM